ncbi:MAG: protein-disulfide reductase DsbD family protein [Aestuariivita sp.]|nr:protein-disulfide reductase DsbD family protein [Aestuariivita sp.]
MMSFIVVIGLPFFVLVERATAQRSVNDIVQLEVLDGGAVSQHTHRIAIRLILAPGWKTYWRVPGEAGIPPKLSFANSDNLKGSKIIWPLPKPFEQNQIQSIGYDEELVLPVDLFPHTPQTAIHLTGKIEIGICKDICIPVSLDFFQKLNPKKSMPSVIKAAYATRSLTAKEANVNWIKCSFSPLENGLMLKANIQMPSTGGTEIAIVESGKSEVWVSEVTTDRVGGILKISSSLRHVNAKHFVLDRSKIQFTILGENRFVELMGCATK